MRYPPARTKWSTVYPTPRVVTASSGERDCPAQLILGEIQPLELGQIPFPQLGWNRAAQVIGGESQFRDAAVMRPWSHRANPKATPKGASLNQFVFVFQFAPFVPL